MKLGLDEYWPRFKENAYSEPKDLADLKFMDKETLRNTFGIEKEGHLRKFTKAVQRLQYPTEGKNLSTLRCIDYCPTQES